MEYDLRQSREEDVDDLMNLIHGVYPDGYPKPWAEYGEIEDVADTFFVAEDEGEIIGCKRMNTEYWPGIVYSESLMVDPDYRGEGLGTDLTVKTVKESDVTVIGLDRKKSAGMMLSRGRESAAFLPEREYFGDQRESLLVTYEPGNKIGDLWDYQSRVKTKKEKPYLIEMTGDNISSEKILEELEDTPMTYTQIINREIKEDSKLSIQEDEVGLIGGRMGEIPLPDESSLGIYVYLPESELEKISNFPVDSREFKQVCNGDKEAIRAIEKAEEEFLP